VRGVGVSADLRAARDAVVATLLLCVLVRVGSGGGAHLDPALYGYLAATVVAVAGTVWRASRFWRRPASAVYARALGEALRSPRRLGRVLAAGADGLAAQRFIAARSRLRWVAHLLLSLGTLASFAITLPLVFGWMRFAADGQTAYRALVFSLRAGRFVLDGPVAWLVFHALSLAGMAVTLGAVCFLVVRARARRLPGAVTAFHVGPLLLLLAVALTGLGLPATRGMPDVFPMMAVLHEASVIVLLVAIPFSKLGHVLIRPLQLGARVVRAADARWAVCAGCGARLAPVAQLAAVERLLAARGARFADHQRSCPRCRRRQVAAVQAGLLGAHFQPALLGTPAAGVRAREEAA
jgi:hypothetical protein